jgi:hypothetical protein
MHGIHSFVGIKECVSSKVHGGGVRMPSRYVPVTPPQTETERKR